jgi:hypothetical protein
MRMCIYTHNIGLIFRALPLELLRKDCEEILIKFIFSQWGSKRKLPLEYHIFIRWGDYVRKHVYNGIFILDIMYMYMYNISMKSSYKSTQAIDMSNSSNALTYDICIMMIAYAYIIPFQLNHPTHTWTFRKKMVDL